MPSKKKKYNARFPPARIKKIMQTDEEIGKVAAAVPVIISRALELFLESLLRKACQVTQSRNAKTMTTSHLKQCIELEQQFDFLKDLVASVPDMQGDVEDNHAEGEKVSRRWAVGGAVLQGEGQGLGAGSRAVGGRTAALAAKERTRSSQARTPSRRRSLRTARLMGRRRRPSPRPPAALPPTSPALRHHICTSPAPHSPPWPCLSPCPRPCLP
ncbi:dr1-associated corepressor isoform X2 [Mauremys mutica]|uniref:dr1-associated corepressor isoform X2 n=1 Tax=Mauremys mutica TaxID=74926 RepID=UPI001D16272A|nr:dr1-associated corepressor isoform X2 [Mauremys mutica]